MSADLAFVGDIHGNVSALRGVLDALARVGERHVVFLGDYINKGRHSSDVLQELISLSAAGRATLLAGNHETALLDAVDHSDLSAFLKMGGAMTIRSYLGRPASADVLEDFLACLPMEHLDALRRMPLAFETSDLVAKHIPAHSVDSRFRISAHVPVGRLPRIGERSALLDTGCGGVSGRLTALLWPELTYVQVDDRGLLVTP